MESQVSLIACMPNNWFKPSPPAAPRLAWLGFSGRPGLGNASGVNSKVSDKDTNMSDFTKVRFVLAVPDLARSTEYYASTLGLAIDFTAPGWTFLSRGDFRVMLGECTDAIPPADLGDHNWYGYVTVSDAAALFADYRDAGVEFTQPLADKPWRMREFGIRTIDGHRIMFGQELSLG